LRENELQFEEQWCDRCVFLEQKSQTKSLIALVEPLKISVGLDYDSDRHSFYHNISEIGMTNS
jgi:hypothetical protein